MSTHPIFPSNKFLASTALSTIAQNIAGGSSINERVALYISRFIVRTSMIDPVYVTTVVPLIAVPSVITFKKRDL
jgi:hypothetical protein